MGFFDKIWRMIMGPDYDEDIRKLDKRIYELNQEKKKAENELSKLEKQEIRIPSFDLSSSTSIKTIGFKAFIPPTLRPIRTMKGLMEERKREEAKRIEQLKLQVKKNYTSIKTFIEDQDADRAENLLLETSSVLQELNDNQLNELFEDFRIKIKILKEELLQKEILIREQEKKRKEEEEARKIEQERLRKIIEEKARIEKERKAKEYEDKLARDEQKIRLEIARLTALVTRKKAEETDILSYLKMKRVWYFYHFTDEQNLNHIKKFGGLYSWSYCENNNILIPNPGGDSDSRYYDKRNGLEDYVRLSFCNDHPMAFRKHKEGAKLILLYIDIEVATFKDTLFSDRNAASSSFNIGGSLEDLKEVNITATKRHYVSRSEGEIFSQHQAECMIKTFIPIKYITNINNPERMYF